MITKQDLKVKEKELQLGKSVTRRILYLGEFHIKFPPNSNTPNVTFFLGATTASQLQVRLPNTNILL